MIKIMKLCCCSNILVKGITIIAPISSPNTGWHQPSTLTGLTHISNFWYFIADSCTNTRIEDCYIAFKMPTKQLVIRRLTCISPYSATIALGSEMSSGIQDVRAEDIVAIRTESGVQIKTAVGRGGYVKDVYERRFTMRTMKWAFWMTGNYGSHADGKYDKKAQQPWMCSDVEGITSGVMPRPCDLLPDQGVEKATACDFPADDLPIDLVELKHVYTILRHPYLDLV
ncbi:unnamed protein product [Malus baccata var. baccata]